MSSIEPHLIRLDFDRNWIERIILELGDAFEIRVQWDKTTVLLTGVCAIAGGILGGYAVGRIGAAVGAGVGGAAGFCMASLRQVWQVVRKKLEELIYIVFNYLRRLDPIDYINAYDILMRCTKSRRELVFAIVDILKEKLGRVVISSLTAA